MGARQTNDTLAVWGWGPSALALPSTCGSLVLSRSEDRQSSAARALKKPVALVGVGGRWPAVAGWGDMWEALAKPLMDNQHCRASVCF